MWSQMVRARLPHSRIHLEKRGSLIGALESMRELRPVGMACCMIKCSGGQENLAIAVEFNKHLCRVHSSLAQENDGDASSTPLRKADAPETSGSALL